MLDPVVAIDDHGIVQEASDSVLDVFGYEPEELIGLNVRVLMPEPHRSSHDEYLAHYRRTGETWILNTTRRFDVLRKDGTPFVCELSVSRVDVPDEPRPLFIGSFRDVTARLEAERRETAVLRSLAAIGESASLLAHEIKNPITGLNIALRALADRLGEDQSELLEDLVRRLRSLEARLRQTLSFAKPLQLSTRECSPGDLLTRVAEAMTDEAGRAGVRLVVDATGEPPPFEVDAGLLDQVLSNLVRNALEVGEGVERVVLRARSEGDACLLEVEDDGPGIPASLRDELFKPFVTSKADGTGLGLAIARKVVEAHGGTIAAANGERGGARFRITLPAVRPMA